jgi:hypothetical protein
MREHSAEPVLVFIDIGHCDRPDRWRGVPTGDHRNGRNELHRLR